MPNLMAGPEDVDRPAENWKYPYVAGAVDWGSNLMVSVIKQDDRAVGYAINLGIRFSSTGSPELGFLQGFCEQHGLSPRLRELENSYKLEVSRRDDLQELLKLVRPYLIARHDEVELLLKHLIPGLNMGKQSSEDGFLELMGYVDEIREHTVERGDAKYDQAHFRSEWGL